MNVLRTPDERFRDLPDFPFEPNYVEVDGLRMHYLDVGDGDPVLLLHGEPSWSFLYRKMIPVLADAGHRAIVPDLIGFGRSDKLPSRDDYSYAKLVDWTKGLVDELDLRNITFFGQDWGGLVGLRMVAADPDRYARVVVGNTGLPTGGGRVTEAFMKWQRFSQETPEFPVGNLINGGCVTDLPPEVIAAYDAPFPDDSYKEAARILPSLVPTSPDDPAAADQKRAWEVLSSFRKPFLCAFSDSDPITRGGDRVFRERVPGAEGQPHTTIEGAGHFLQEDEGPELARVIADFIAST